MIQLLELGYFEHVRKQLKAELAESITYLEGGSLGDEFARKSAEFTPIMRWLDSVERDATELVRERESSQET